jgi:hypothetical protein
MTATQMATVYGYKSPQAFNKLMVKCGVLTKNDKGYFLADYLRGFGYTAVIDQPYFLPNGIRATRKKAVWTEEGQKFIRARLGRFGITPVNEHTDIFTTN